LRTSYKRLVNLLEEPAFADGEFYSLNPPNHSNSSYGRLPNEQSSGHWLYSFIRYHASTPQRFVVVVNLHPSITFTDVRILLSASAMQLMNFEEQASTHLKLTNRLT